MRTVDYVLFADSTVKVATNRQQWYVTISRGKKGVCIVTPDKEQLRENVLRSGHRTLALDLVKAECKHRPNRNWFQRIDAALGRFGKRAARLMRQSQLFAAFSANRKESHERKIARVLGQ